MVEAGVKEPLAQGGIDSSQLNFMEPYPVPEGMGLRCFWLTFVCDAGMPAEAHPQSAKRGRLSYTLTSSRTGAKIEVLLKQKAFRISKIGQDSEGVDGEFALLA